MSKCPHCGSETKQRKDGRTKAGSARYRCGYCRRKYTPVPKQQGYPNAIRQQAIQLYVDGMNFRRIARQLKVNHQSVINWVNAYIATLPDQTPQPQKVSTVEMDEIFTFIGDKKTEPTS